MKILNLYAGIGGNRKHWDGHEITAVENHEGVAAIYSDLYPDDTVIVDDAHQYLLDHYMEFDFIWSSPPCPTHSKLSMANKCYPDRPTHYPDMALYQEIILLQWYTDCYWIVENVMPYYQPLLKPTAQIGRHYFWSSYYITGQDVAWNGCMTHQSISDLEAFHDVRIDWKTRGLSRYNYRKILRNCCHSAIGKQILDQAGQSAQIPLF